MKVLLIFSLDVSDEDQEAANQVTDALSALTPADLPHSDGTLRCVVTPEPVAHIIEYLDT